VALICRYALTPPPFARIQLEGFWKYYNHLVRPHDLPNTSDYHLFKEGIKPMWEVHAQLASRSLRDLPNSLSGVHFDLSRPSHRL
jgi:hypothetical protein